MNKKGQTIVEFALTALIFFTFLFAIIDFAVMFYVDLTMQNAVRQGARYAITGKGGSDGASRKAALIQKIKDSSNGLYDKNACATKDPTISVVTPSSATFSNYTGSPAVGTGQPDQIIVVSLTYAWPLLTPILKPFFADGQYTFTARATMKNELWGP